MTPQDLAQRRHVLFTMLTACAWRDSPAGRRAHRRRPLPRATFYPASRGHSVTSAVGSAWEREPWIAVQQAAWEGLRNGETA